MSRERKFIIRPFDDAYEELWTSLQSTVLKTPAARFVPGDHKLSDSALLSLPTEAVELDIDIEFDQLESTLKEVDLELSDLRLSVQTYSRFMNLSDVVFSELLSDLGRASVVVPLTGQSREDIDPLFAAFTGFQVRAVLTLDRDRSTPEDSLAPRLRHSILSEARFEFTSVSSEGNGLDYHRLTDEVRETERVPRDAAIYIKSVESPTSVNKLSDALSIYIDSQLLERMLLKRRTSVGKLHIAQLGINILSDLVVRSSVDLNRRAIETGTAPTFESLGKTVTAKLIGIVERKGQPAGRRYEASELLEELMDRPQKMLSRVQAIYGYRGSALDSFDMEGDSQ
jgi:hypothetical protein